MAVTLTQIFGTNAIRITQTGNAHDVTLKGSDFLADGLDPAEFTLDIHAERLFAGLIIHNAKRNYKKTDGTDDETINVVTAPSFGGVTLTTRNGIQQYKYSYTIDIYVPAPGITAYPDPGAIAA
jgi:hypothetical protein